MIEFKSISKTYSDNPAVENLSLEIYDHELCVLIGPSGCGKSTTLKMINRMIEPTLGEICINSTPVKDFNLEELRRSIGYVIQSVGLFPHMTVEENIAVVPKLLKWGTSRISTRMKEMIDLIRMERTYLNKYPSELSGGEAQRVGVARALAADPPLLLMDEPFGAVDPITRERLQRDFLDIQRELKKTVVFVTHDMDEAISLGDRIAIMEKGHLVQYNTPEKILKKPANKFVREFMGTDRALKRLSRFPISDYIKPAPIIKISKKESISHKDLSTLSEAFYWTTDEGGKLTGWFSMEDYSSSLELDNALTTVHPEEISVFKNASFKEVLSKMIGNGIQSLAIIDSNIQIIGCINFKDIEKVVQKHNKR